MKKNPRHIAILSLVTVLLGASPARALLFTGSSGSLSASGDFSSSGTNLVVILTNTSSADVLVPADVLTAIFFDVAGVGVLTRVSGVLTGGSTVFFGGTDPGGVVGGEWAYASSLVGAPGGATEGISSAGFGLFGSGDLFPGSDLQSPASPDGLQYGITSAGDDTTTGNTPVTGTEALIKNSVTFTLDGLPSGFLPSRQNITNVSFQFGTALTEPNIPVRDPQVPEPSTLLLLTTGLIGLARAKKTTVH